MAGVLFSIQVLYLIICVLESWLEKIVIDLKNPGALNYILLNKKEHRRSAVYAVFVGLSLIASAIVSSGFRWQYLVLIPVLLALRRIGFDFFLKLFRNRKIRDIEGNGFVDGIFKNVYGDKGGWLDLLTCLVLVAVVNLLIYYTA